MEIRTAAPGAPIQADTARRVISGLVVPWDEYAMVSSGQTVAFARGSVHLSERAKLVLDHDPTRPVAVYQSSADTADGLTATFKVPAGAAGDAVLADAAAGLRDGLSVAADVADAEETDAGLYVRAAKGRHVALLSEPAFDAARVSAVHAAKGAPVSDTALSASTNPQVVTMDDPTPVVSGAPGASQGPVVTAETPTAAGLVAAAAPVRVRTDPYPYATPMEAGGPSFVRDALEAMENPASEGASRWRKAQLMAADPAVIAAGMARLAPRGAEILAATGTTTGETALVPPHWLPERYVTLKAAKAPLYSVLVKYGTPDFTTLDIPRTLTETGLSGLPTDEVTPIAPGDITTGNDTVTIVEVEGAYAFSRKLLLGSNPQIDRIALDAMERAWLADVEARAVTFFTTAANGTPVSATYADGNGYVTALRADLASGATGVYTFTDILPPQKEYIAAATASYTGGQPTLPQPPVFNVVGDSGPGYHALHVQGIPLWPGRAMPANKSLILAQADSAACVFETPVMNFRLEWTTDATTGGNVKVLKLVKYSGVGFWSQYPGGVHIMTNTTPLPLDAGGDGPEAGTAPGVEEHETSGRKK